MKPYSYLGSSTEKTPQENSSLSRRKFLKGVLTHSVSTAIFSHSLGCTSTQKKTAVSAKKKIEYTHNIEKTPLLLISKYPLQRTHAETIKTVDLLNEIKRTRAIKPNQIELFFFLADHYVSPEFSDDLRQRKKISAFLFVKTIKEIIGKQIQIYKAHYLKRSNELNLLIQKQASQKTIKRYRSSLIQIKRQIKAMEQYHKTLLP